MWWHGGAGLTERSERWSLSAVATHDVFAVVSDNGVTRAGLGIVACPNLAPCEGSRHVALRGKPSRRSLGSRPLLLFGPVAPTAPQIRITRRNGDRIQKARSKAQAHQNLVRFRGDTGDGIPNMPSPHVTPAHTIKQCDIRLTQIAGDAESAGMVKDELGCLHFIFSERQRARTTTR
jgi:hypothetical protein